MNYYLFSQLSQEMTSDKVAFSSDLTSTHETSVESNSNRSHQPQLQQNVMKRQAPKPPPSPIITSSSSSTNTTSTAVATAIPVSTISTECDTKNDNLTSFSYNVSRLDEAEVPVVKVRDKRNSAVSSTADLASRSLSHDSLSFSSSIYMPPLTSVPATVSGIFCFTCYP